MRRLEHAELESLVLHLVAPEVLRIRRHGDEQQRKRCRDGPLQHGYSLALTSSVVRRRTRVSRNRVAGRALGRRIRYFGHQSTAMGSSEAFTRLVVQWSRDGSSLSLSMR